MVWLAMSWYFRCGQHGDSGCGDGDEDFGAGVGDADAEVVQAAGVAQGEFAAGVDGVVADAEVFVGTVAGRSCFG